MSVESDYLAEIVQFSTLNFELYQTKFEILSKIVQAKYNLPVVSVK